MAGGYSGSEAMLDPMLNRTLRTPSLIFLSLLAAEGISGVGMQKRGDVHKDAVSFALSLGVSLSLPHTRA